MRVRVKPAFRRSIQAAFALYFCVVAVQFSMYVAWALGRSEIFVPKPAAVEAFLPISAMLAAKRFVLTGLWDSVHPAGLTIFFFALTCGLLLRKSFCGYFCPLGAVSDLLFRLGRRWGLVRTLPPWATYLMLLPKYLLLAFFLSMPLVLMGLPEIEDFLHSHYNLVADTKMLFFFLEPSLLVVGTVVLLVVASLLVPSLWCRAFCPYGALLGLLAWLSPAAVQRDASRCTGCGACASACPQALRVEHCRRMRSPECTGCLECVRVCREGALSMRLGWSRTWYVSVPAFAVLVLAVLALFYGLAVATGHWESQVPLEMVRMLHEHLDQIQHF